MEHIPVLRDLVVLVAVAIPAVLLAHRLNIPTLVGFLFTGIVIGPHALGFVRDTESVTQMAEIGSVLLLFAVGLELSLSRIVKMGRYVIQGGMIQMLGTIGIVASVAVIAGLPVNSAVLWGALIALSSTAIILKIYADRGELDSVHGKLVVAILLFQDLCVVPLMVLMPLLAGTQQGAMALVRAVVLTAAVTGALIIAGRFIVPRFLARVTQLRNAEIFTLCVLAIGLGSAFLTSYFGLSLALGAVLAGLIVSESEYGLQALSDVLPFRDAFSGIFFTSIGMLLNIHFFFDNALLVLAVALGAILLKTLAGYGVVRFVRRSARAGIISGLGWRVLVRAGERSLGGGPAGGQRVPGIPGCGDHVDAGRAVPRAIGAGHRRLGAAEPGRADDGIRDARGSRGEAADGPCDHRRVWSQRKEPRARAPQRRDFVRGDGLERPEGP